ncbi:putative disease resistance RPP13-like protein 1 [Prunus persica]|uniref:putative disease resistance RPP13-like protein 1 n=1 Tax=Prunus persica TaxID=3760 RepID=UPI0009AB95BD|nr:putative disease resistance RPP13-like protein 1 [Prunus persica]
MAGASIGEAFISASIQVLCDRLTSREFIDLFRQKKLDQPLPMKLKVTLLTLNVVLNDAGEKQRENPAVREWLDELKHAVFDAEDLLDEINYEALRCKLEDTRVVTKIRRLCTAEKCSWSERRSWEEGFTKTPTTSLVHEPCVYGRDEVKENLSKMLLSDDASKDDVSVITIVGMGGVGKTTLARMLYNDHKVEEHFTLKAWACVSEDSKIDPNMKLLVVTCKNVASVMQNVPIQFLEPLSNEDCWLLLAKHAFGNESSSSHPSLEEIGRQIARKCNGLPLAVQTLGGVLRCKIDSEVWNRVLNNNIWELPYEKSDILPALGLSYHYLPAKLK